MWRMWISPKIYKKSLHDRSEWHSWQMLTAASMAGCSHGFLEQNSAPVWSTCQSFQIRSSTPNTQSAYMQNQLTQMILYDVSQVKDGFDAFVTKYGSNSPLFTLCSYSEPLQQPARSVSKSSNNWRAHLVMVWNLAPRHWLSSQQQTVTSERLTLSPKIWSSGETSSFKRGFKSSGNGFWQEDLHILRHWTNLQNFGQGTPASVPARGSSSCEAFRLCKQNPRH